MHTLPRPHQEELRGAPSELQVPFHRASVGEEEVQAVSEVIRSGWLTMGPKTFEFEKEFAKYVGAQHAIAVSTGTAALHLSLEAAGVQAGDEVLLPTTTFTATAEAVTYAGARPVLVDIDPVTMNMDVEDAARRITPKTKAIIPVHLGGQPCDMDEIQTIAQRHHLRVIEDAAHALPSEYQGKWVGQISEFTCFSFYATKTMTTGEGGMITTHNPVAADRIRLMRLHGIEHDAWKRYRGDGSWFYEVLEAGFKYNLTDFQSAMGLVQLDKCDVMKQAREKIAQRYSDAFSSREELVIPTIRQDRSTSWHLYILRLCLDCLNKDRNGFIEALHRRGVACSVHFTPLHLQPYYRRVYGYQPGDFPRAEREYRSCLSLPIYPGMTEMEINHVIGAVLNTATESRIVPSVAAMSIQVLDRKKGQGGLVRDAEQQSTFAKAFYGNYGKRALDILSAMAGLILLSPVFGLVACCIKLTSRGPVLYRQVRTGKDGRPFQILKFRSMVTQTPKRDLRITVAGDPRVTAFGTFLRRYKVDELPQLWNVVRGEMSLVGPRPELPVYVAEYTPEQHMVLSARPGITDPASLAYRHEEEILADQGDPEQFYRTQILPDKLARNRAYLQKITLRNDIRIILKTISYSLSACR